MKLYIKFLHLWPVVKRRFSPNVSLSALYLILSREFCFIARRQKQKRGLLSGNASKRSVYERDVSAYISGFQSPGTDSAFDGPEPISRANRSRRCASRRHASRQVYIKWAAVLYRFANLPFKRLENIYLDFLEQKKRNCLHKAQLSAIARSQK